MVFAFIYNELRQEPSHGIIDVFNRRKLLVLVYVIDLVFELFLFDLD